MKSVIVTVSHYAERPERDRIKINQPVTQATLVKAKRPVQHGNAAVCAQRPCARPARHLCVRPCSGSVCKAVVKELIKKTGPAKKRTESKVPSLPLCHTLLPPSPPTTTTPATTTTATKGTTCPAQLLAGISTSRSRSLCR
eukprot:3492990-Rhodomonas_salina.2